MLNALHHRRPLIVIGFFVLTFAVYGASLGNGLVGWDDRVYLNENTIVSEFSLANLAAAWTTYDPELYVPLVILSYQLTHLMVGLDPFLYHLTNVVLHAGNAVLVVWFVMLLLRNRGNSSTTLTASGTSAAESKIVWVALVCGLLFALHPFNVESASWVSARKDVMVTFFYLLTLIFYLRFRTEGEKLWLHVSLGSCLLGFLSKVSIVTVPFVLLLLDWFHGRKLHWNTFREKWPFFALSVVFGLIALGGKGGSAQVLPTEKLLMGARAIVLYLTHLFWPQGLSVLYPYTEPITITNPELLLSVLFVTVTTVVAIIVRKRLRVFTFGWLFFLLTVVVTFPNFAHGLNLLMDVYIGSDRYAYISSIGIFFIVAVLLSQLRRRFKRCTDVGVALALILLAILSERQSLTWRDDDALFTNVLRFYPNSHVAQNNIGGSRYNRGDIPGALNAFQKSIAIRPNASAFFNLGQISKDNGQLPEAVRFYRLAIESDPVDLSAHINLGVALMELENFEEAESVLKAATEIDPASTTAYFNLGFLYEKMGRKDEALRAYERVLLLDPRDREVEGRMRELSGNS